jgi:hypothetical protein
MRRLPLLRHKAGNVSLDLKVPVPQRPKRIGRRPTFLITEAGSKAPKRLRCRYRRRSGSHALHGEHAGLG